MTTAGDCRYRQAIPVGFGGRLDVDTNLGIRKAFLPQGKRKYTPLRQPTAQQVLIEKISAEFNIFGDPFAAYQVIHSGIPVTLVPLDATNTIPISEEFFDEFEKNQDTYEAQYCFKSLKMTRDTWFDNNFYT
ncbi:inosine-uridine preferring nucleoside hydrolase-related family protein, partial [Trifolium medium]|nr:inosine-uridine preferring nucleoside hydrolase-related family protein [Trifolium medium]